MLDINYLRVFNYIKPTIRLNALSSGYNYGSLDISDDHILEKMDSFSKNITESQPFDTYYDLINRPFPTTANRVRSKPVVSDIMLGDNFRQNRTIEEQFRRSVTLGDIRKLSDGTTRYWLSNTRGNERWLINYLNELEAEGINRKSIYPLI